MTNLQGVQWHLWGGGAGRLGFKYVLECCPTLIINYITDTGSWGVGQGDWVSDSFLECWNLKLINYITFRGGGVLHIHVGLDIKGY